MPGTKLSDESVAYILTVYNKERFLKNVLESINEEYKHTGGEIIIVDDGSTDRSSIIIDDFKKAKDYVFVHHKKNGGVSSATNCGFFHSRCQYIRFVDGDDIILKGSTKLLMSAIAQSGIGFAFGKYDRYDIDTYQRSDEPIKYDGKFKVVKNPTIRMLTSQPFIPSITLVQRSILVNIFPLNETYMTSQDFIVGLRLSYYTEFVELNDICCLAPDVAPGRLSSSMARMYADTALLIGDELERPANWPLHHKKFAVRRNASRAINYARRHLNCGLRHMLWLYSMRLLSYLPFDVFGSETFKNVASTYEDALKEPGRYP